MDHDLARLDATEQARLVQLGALSPAELVQAAVECIAAVNPTLNAVIHDLGERALAQAAAGMLGDGPFRGVPFLVKDGLCHTAGDPFHNGMRALQRIDWHEPDDSWLAARYRAAGFAFVGKTNLPELATTVTTEPLAYGPTRNPWDVTRSTGGSSGGAAAAVAAGLVPVAHGNDMGGSIRFPAGWCGIVGLKPSRARTTLGPHHGEYWGPLTHEHVLTRSVRDTAAVLDVTAGPGPGDPYTAPPPSRPWAQEVGADAGRLRIGMRTTSRGDLHPVHPECAAAVQATAALLAQLGHEVDDDACAALDAPGMDDAFGTIFTVAIARDLERWRARTGTELGPDDLEPANALLAHAGAAVGGVDYVAALEQGQAWSRGVVAWWADHDLLVLPTATEPAVPLGTISPDVDPGVALTRAGALTTFTMPFNMTGQPAISLPLHWTADGLPVGVQLVAAPWREDLLLRVAAQLEAARPWADRRPPVHA